MEIDKRLAVYWEETLFGNTMNSITVLDIGVIVVTVAFLVRGVWVGFVRQLAFIIALVMGFVAAGNYYPVLSRYGQWIENPQLRFVVAYTLLFLATYVLIMFIGVGLKKVMQVTFLGWFDRMMGGFFGLAKAVFISTLCFMALAGVLSSTSPVIQKSFFSPYLMASAEFLTSFIKDKSLQKELVPKKPAISSFFSDPVPVLQLLGGDSK